MPTFSRLVWSAAVVAPRPIPKRIFTRVSFRVVARTSRNAVGPPPILDGVAEPSLDTSAVRLRGRLDGLTIRDAARLGRRLKTLRGATPEKLQPGQDPLSGVLDYVRRALRAFHRSPEMTALMLQMMTSSDPEARATIDQMNRTNVELFNRLLDGMAPPEIPNVSFGLNAALIHALTGFSAGKLTLEDALAHVEWIARAVLSERR